MRRAIKEAEEEGISWDVTIQEISRAGITRENRHHKAKITAQPDSHRVFMRELHKRGITVSSIQTTPQHDGKIIMWLREVDDVRYNPEMENSGNIGFTMVE